MNHIVALFAGLVFGLGLVISGMSNPQKVIGFLDVTGTWDPTLMLVMIGAIGVGLIPFRMATQKDKTLFGEPMPSFNKTQIDSRLVIGSGLFGIGWGLAGICPGPGITLLGSGMFEGVIFVLSMLAGMYAFQIYQSSKLP